MSFSKDVKLEIIKNGFKNACCKRAFLNGIIFSKGKITDSGGINISLQDDDVIQFVCELISDIFLKNAKTESFEKGGRGKKIIFSSNSAEKYLSNIKNDKDSYFTARCSECKSSFVKGILAACGRISDPEKQYRVEFSPLDIPSLKEYFEEENIFLNEGRRKNEMFLYSSNSVTIEDFLVISGLNGRAFDFMNKKITGEFRNNANRVRNCETNNIDKTVSAASRQTAAIMELDKNNMISMLAEELENTAKLRLMYPDYSLARLAGEFTPPISKSGLSHRLNKIVEIAEKIKRGEKI